MRDGKAFEVAGASDTDRANARTYPANGSNAQKWFIYTIDNKYVFRPACSQTRVLDVQGYSTAEGANIMIYHHHNTSNERFSVYKIQDQTSYSIKTDKSSYKTGENATVTISNTKYAYNYKLHIIKPDGSEKVVDNGEKNTYTFAETQPGTYKVYAEVKGPINTSKGSATDRYVEIVVKPDTIAVESVSISDSKIGLAKDEAYKLSAFVNPVNATNKKVSWSSSDASVVSVDENGNLKALKKGVAKITARTEDGGKTVSCEVTVNADPILEGIEIEDGDAITMTKNSTRLLSAKVLPENADDKTVTWFSDNNNVAEVDENGTVKAYRPGKATITAATNCLYGINGKQFYFKDTIEITVVDPDKIEINETNFPDPEFRKYVSENIDTDKNGNLNTGEIEETDEIEVDNMGITSLKGIEFFTNLQILSCRNNNLTRLDVSNNKILHSLDCTYNKLLSLDLSSNKELSSLYSYQKQINMDTTDKVLDLAAADPDLDPKRIKNLEGGELSGSKLINLPMKYNPSKFLVRYEYETGFGDNVMQVYIQGSIDQIDVTGVLTDPLFIKNLEVGESKIISAVVLPMYATNQKVTWSSSNTNIAIVDENGKVTAKKAGTATITAKTEDGGKTATCTVTVNPKEVLPENVALDRQSLVLDKGESGKLTATVTPADAKDKTVTC